MLMNDSRCCACVLYHQSGVEDAPNNRPKETESCSMGMVSCDVGDIQLLDEFVQAEEWSIPL